MGLVCGSVATQPADSMANSPATNLHVVLWESHAACGHVCPLFFLPMMSHAQEDNLRGVLLNGDARPSSNHGGPGSNVLASGVLANGKKLDSS